MWHYTKMGNPLYAFRRNSDHILFYAKSKSAIFNEVSLGRPSIFYERHKKLVKNNKLYYKDIKQTHDSLMYSKIKVFEKKNAHRKDIDDIAVFDFSDTKDQMKSDNVWNIPPINNVSKERTGYPTQKPLALLERILQASSNEGDVVLDPFCGCATTCVAAEKLSRQWIGIDISVKAYELVQTRLRDEVYAEGLIKGEDGNLPPIYFSTDPPTRTDRAHDTPEKKYVYIISHPKYEGEYKVGIASNVQRRLKSYQTSDPAREYKLEYTIATERYRELERHIHTTFHTRHEWVSANLSDIIAEMERYG